LLTGLNNTNSLAEEIQKTFPDTMVIKTLNTMWCGLMVNPKLVGNGDHINFISGNNSEAKNKVIKLLNQFGWLDKNILDIGDITGARATESLLPQINHGESLEDQSYLCKSILVFFGVGLFIIFLTRKLNLTSEA